ncbi:MAG TPA: hypothetical protein VJQ79_12425 [Acidimicrobiia bacterium]|nr:hypothetical protein [Acidimicrobiia bacterium]
MARERFSLKDHLFNRSRVSYLAGLLAASIPQFDAARFESEVMGEMLDLELKQRIAHIARVLANHLDPDFRKAAGQILRSLPPPLDPDRDDGDFGDFIFAPFGDFVAERGLDDYETAMSLIRQLTMRFSMEGPVRLFIEAEPERTLDRFATWARDDHYHVRRLVSESTRPALPWAPRISLAIAAPLPLLDMLHADTTRYVTRSVANHLNDISKADPRLVIETLQKWRGLGIQKPSELDWMSRHALRTLVRRGSPDAMQVLGYSIEPEVGADIIEITPNLTAGDALEFVVSVSARADEQLIVDYVIGFVKKNGSINSKTFRLGRIDLPAGGTRILRKRHPLRSDATTYKLYPGRHTLTIVANGTVLARTEFDLIC